MDYVGILECGIIGMFKPKMNITKNWSVIFYRHVEMAVLSRNLESAYCRWRWRLTNRIGIDLLR